MPDLPLRMNCLRRINTPDRFVWQAEGGAVKKRIGWDEVCPSCAKFARRDDVAGEPCCDGCAVTEGMLCDFVRMEHESDPDDFECEAFEPKGCG